MDANQDQVELNMMDIHKSLFEMLRKIDSNRCYQREGVYSVG